MGHVVYHVFFGLPFGYVSSVSSWCRVPALMAMVARRMFACLCDSYIDDWCIVDFADAESSSQDTLHALDTAFKLPLAACCQPYCDKVILSPERIPVRVLFFDYHTPPIIGYSDGCSSVDKNIHGLRVVMLDVHDGTASSPDKPAGALLSIKTTVALGVSRSTVLATQSS